jgi:peptide subunit release factor 1 (eRF1)
LLYRSTVERLRGADTAGHPVVSVYLSLGPDRDQLRSITPRLKALAQPLREAAGEWGEEAVRGVRRDLDRVVALAEQVSADRGRGTAFFVCSAAGLEEHIGLPGPVRDRAVVDTTPYLGPLEAMLAHFRRYCAVVADRRLASIYRFHMGSLESWEEMAEEAVRKDNYGGFAGYAEHASRRRAGEVARRHFRAVAVRLSALFRAGEFELLAVGGNQANIDGLVAELPSDLAAVLAGTFVVDPRSAAPAEIRDRCAALAQEHEGRADERLVADLMEAAGARGRGVLGLDRVLDAANQHAVDLLLLDAGETVPGAACPECGRLARSGGACPSCGVATRRVADLFDAAAEAVRATGGAVRYVLAPTPLARFEAGALVRFPVGGAGE